MIIPLRRRMGALVIALITSLGFLLGPAALPASAAGIEQVVSWGASPFRVSAVGSLTDRTVRNLVHTSIGGPGARISLSNAYGDRPVTLDSVYVGLQADGAELVPDSNRRVTFAGRTAVTVQPGESVRSDRLTWAVPADTTLAVSVHVVGESGMVTGHNVAKQTSYLSESGDTAADESGAAYTTQIQNWLWVEAVTVEAAERAGTVAFFGDSITDGNGSTSNANLRYPDQLADRLDDTRYSRLYGVMNRGISANRLLVDGTGDAGLSRFERDVLDQPGIETAVVMIGINDIRWDNATEPADLTDAYQQLIDQAHRQDVCVIGGTLTPFAGSSRYTDAREQVRNGVNEWIRSSGAFDAVADFDAAVRDPENPGWLIPAFDADHLHPNDAGYAAMAGAIDLAALDCSRG